MKLTHGHQEKILVMFLHDSEAAYRTAIDVIIGYVLISLVCGSFLANSNEFSEEFHSVHFRVIADDR